MLTGLEKILFVLLAAGTFYLGAKSFLQVYRVILRGKAEDRFDNLAQRVFRAVKIVLLQQSIFKARPWVSFFHALIFYGFVYYALVNLIDVIEALLGFRGQGTFWGIYGFI